MPSGPAGARVGQAWSRSSRGSRPAWRSGVAAHTSFSTLLTGLALGGLGVLGSLVSLLSGLAAFALARGVARDASPREQEDRRWGLAFGLAGPGLAALTWALLLAQ